MGQNARARSLPSPTREVGQNHQKGPEMTPDVGNRDPEQGDLGVIVGSRRVGEEEADYSREYVAWASRAELSRAYDVGWWQGWRAGRAEASEDVRQRQSREMRRDDERDG